MRWPLDSEWDVTSPFGRRFHPVLHIWRLHAGADFVRSGAKSTGSALRAVADGKVSANLGVAKNPGGGNFVEIKLDVGGFARYFHMRDKSPLRVGTRVDEGDVVGHLGNTGSWTTGPHLHFEILTKKRRPIDPVDFIEGRISAHPAAIAVPKHRDPIESDEDEEDEMKTIQIHYVEPGGKVIRAMITPGTAYFAPWEETGGAIANGLARALTGSSVAMTKSMFEMLRTAAQKLEPKDLELALPVSNVDGTILEDPSGFPLGPDGTPLDPVDVQELDPLDPQL
jgi:hypothetical protein